MNPDQTNPIQRKSKTNLGLTFIEVLIVVITMSVLIGLAVPVYRGLLKKAENAEAIVNMGAIRRAEFTKHLEANTYLNADDTNIINDLFGLGIEEHIFTYKVVDASDSSFKIIAKRLGTDEEDELTVLSMTPSGEVLTEPNSLNWIIPTNISNPISGGFGPSEGSNSSNMGGLESNIGGFGGSGGGFGSTGGSSGSSVMAGSMGSEGASGPIEKPQTSFPDATTPNIPAGPDALKMQEVFDILKNDGGDLGASLAQTLIFRQVPLRFVDVQAVFSQPSDVIGLVSGPIDGTFGGTALYLDDSLLSIPDESEQEIASTLAHEATHVEQRFDPTIIQESENGTAFLLADIEGPAYANETLIWDKLRRDKDGNIVLQSSNQSDMDFRADHFILPDGSIDEAAQDLYISVTRGISPVQHV